MSTVAQAKRRITKLLSLARENERAGHVGAALDNERAARLLAYRWNLRLPKSVGELFGSRDLSSTRTQRTYTHRGHEIHVIRGLSGARWVAYVKRAPSDPRAQSDPNLTILPGQASPFVALAHAKAHVDRHLRSRT